MLGRQCTQVNAQQSYVGFSLGLGGDQIGKVAAQAALTRCLDHPGVVLNSITGALEHFQLGRAYALAGDEAKARAAYQDFFALWKDADPDIPILKQAKGEYAKPK